MNKKIIYLIFFLILILFANCSFDNVTGIWSGSEKEKKRISELEEEQRQIIDVEKIYSSGDIYAKEKHLTENIHLSVPKKNLSNLRWNK